MNDDKHKDIKESHLTEEEQDMILDEAMPEVHRVNPQEKKRTSLNPVLKEYLAHHKVLVSWVKDVYGFKKGAVVATDGRIGYSLVSSHDVRWERMDPMCLPVIHQLVAEGKPVSEIQNHPAYKKCIRDKLAVKIPLFDRDIALFTAIGRAVESVTETESIGELALPHDKELREVATRMLDRAKKYFK